MVSRGEREDIKPTWYWDEIWLNFRRGDVFLNLLWENNSARIRLFNDGVPTTVNALLQVVPLRIPVIHVAWSGAMVMSAVQIPLGVERKENRTRLPRPGDICYDPECAELTITYDAAEARLPSGPNTLVVIGSMESNLDSFGNWARRRRFFGQGEIVLQACEI